MESLFLLAFGEEKSLAAPAMTGSEAFFNKLLEIYVARRIATSNTPETIELGK
jgi:hypothetical protein